eukprot:6436920-Amphidinium_carterae.1
MSDVAERPQERRRITHKRPATDQEEEESRNKFRAVELCVNHVEALHVMTVSPEETDSPLDDSDRQVSIDALDDETVKQRARELQTTVDDVRAAVAAEIERLKSFSFGEVRRKEERPSDARELVCTMVLGFSKSKGCTKARICVQDYRTDNRLDVFAPTPTAASLRCLLMVAQTYDLEVMVGDFSAAFLHVSLDEDVW